MAEINECKHEVYRSTGTGEVEVSTVHIWSDGVLVLSSPGDRAVEIDGVRAKLKDFEDTQITHGFQSGQLAE